MSDPGAVPLAAVFTPNPDHPLTWTGLFGFLILIVGIGIVVLGAVLSVALVRGIQDRKWGGYVIGPLVTAIGLAVSYGGVQLL
ncbi:hypothetical protein ABZT06_17395 [Streptomyces sp. NPDC005483]|uniref:hypothetical protein n=1 Tax=Streptomyces sp. NPDC005483 TaxID=3154882 RepID=UPI0033AD7028